MMLLVLLVPIGLLAVLLAMERLERWTVEDHDNVWAQPASSGHGVAGPPPS